MFKKFAFKATLALSIPLCAMLAEDDGLYMGIGYQIGGTQQQIDNKGRALRQDTIQSFRDVGVSMAGNQGLLSITTNSVMDALTSMVGSAYGNSANGLSNIINQRSQADHQIYTTQGLQKYLANLLSNARSNDFNLTHTFAPAVSIFDTVQSEFNRLVVGGIHILNSLNTVNVGNDSQYLDSILRTMRDFLHISSSVIPATLASPLDDIYASQAGLLMQSFGSNAQGSMNYSSNPLLDLSANNPFNNIAQRLALNLSQITQESVCSGATASACQTLNNKPSIIQGSLVANYLNSTTSTNLTNLSKTIEQAMGIAKKQATDFKNNQNEQAKLVSAQGIEGVLSELQNLVTQTQNANTLNPLVVALHDLYLYTAVMANNGKFTNSNPDWQPNSPPLLHNTKTGTFPSVTLANSTQCSAMGFTSSGANGCSGSSGSQTEAQKVEHAKLSSINSSAYGGSGSYTIPSDKVNVLVSNAQILLKNPEIKGLLDNMTLPQSFGSNSTGNNMAQTPPQGSQTPKSESMYTYLTSLLSTINSDKTSTTQADYTTQFNNLKDALNFIASNTSNIQSFTQNLRELLGGGVQKAGQVINNTLATYQADLNNLGSMLSRYDKPYLPQFVAGKSSQHGVSNGLGVQIGYKQFFGRSRNFGLRYYGFFDYGYTQLGNFDNVVRANIFTYGVGTDFLWNIFRRTFLDKALNMGIYGGIQLAGNTWDSSLYHQIKTNFDSPKHLNPTNFQFLFNLGLRANFARATRYRFLQFKNHAQIIQHGVEFGVKIPAINQAYLRSAGADVTYRRLYIFYVNYNIGF